MRRNGSLVESVLRTFDLLEAFRSEQEHVSLEELSLRASLPKPTACRLLRTLESRGYVRRSGSGIYQLQQIVLPKRKLRFAFCAESESQSFSREVGGSIERGARRYNVDMLQLDNRYSGKAALRNVELCIREKVDLIMQFQVDEHAAPVISRQCQQAGIPLIAIDIPHPGATYFGANNYVAGLMAGRYAARWVRQNWPNKTDKVGVVLLSLPQAGAVPGARLTGALEALQQQIPGHRFSVVELDGAGLFERSWEVTRRFLRTRHLAVRRNEQANAERLLIFGVNDPAALGAARAVAEAGLTEQVAIISHNAVEELRGELRRDQSSIVGAIAYFPEQYGERLFPLAFSILEGHQTPPAIFVPHEVITRANVGRFYPNDRGCTLNGSPPFLELDSSSRSEHPFWKGTQTEDENGVHEGGRRSPRPLQGTALPHSAL